jgi:peptidoglycan/xylan/chitin deacetylase (PgdA/CDA1 family)
MGGRTVISPTARGWRIRRRWRGQLPPDKTPIHALLHRRWLVEATCLGIPPERWVWQVAGRHASVAAVEEVAAALARDDPSPRPGHAELIEHVTGGGPPSPLGHVRLTSCAVPDAHRPAGDSPPDGRTGLPPPASPASPASEVRLGDSAQPVEPDVAAPPGPAGSSRTTARPVLYWARRRRRRVGPFTAALVLVVLVVASVALWSLATPRHPAPARRAARTTPTRPIRGRRVAPTSAARRATPCPPPAPVQHGPVGVPGRRAPPAAVRHSPWVRYQLPVSGHAGKTVALTFDDGPDPRFTPPILAILARARVPATFFMVGGQAAAHPDLVRRVAGAGQAVGGHTWHHVRLDRLAPAGVAAEVDCADQLLARLAGQPVRLVRPPDGAYDSSVVGLLAARDVVLTLWTVDSRDWARPGVGRIEATVTRELRPGAIILFHDGGGDRSQTVAALPGVLGLLHARGYRAVALPTPPGQCCSTSPREPGKLPRPAHQSWPSPIRVLPLAPVLHPAP